MITLVVASSKGGSGKTTLTVHLAVAAQRSGLRVAIIDADPQASAVAWAQARESAEPYVVAVAAIDVPTAIENAATEGFVDLLIVDTQPRAAASLTRILERADFALIPVRPSPFDLATGAITQQIVVAACVPFAFILNACKPRSPDIGLSRAVLAEIGSVFEQTIGERTVYVRSLQTGRSCQEFDPASDAASEIERAWHELSRRSYVVSPIRAEA